MLVSSRSKLPQILTSAKSSLSVAQTQLFTSSATAPAAAANFSTTPQAADPAQQTDSWSIRCTQTNQSFDITSTGEVSTSTNQTLPSSGSVPPLRQPPTSSLRDSLLRQTIATFFPSGYPSTVSPGYLRYTLWQALHHAAGSANGVLASSFLLYSVGLGAGAVPTAGALNFILKDGLGQAGTLLFGRFVAHNFDVAPRSWYLAASAKLNVAMGLEIATFIVPHAFLPLGAAANAIKGLAWMAGGSSRSAFNVSFAADSNIADVTAKATSQTICTSLLGTSLGLALAANIEQSVGMAFGCYAALAAVHLWTGWESARCVPLSTLNPSRLAILADVALQEACLKGSNTTSGCNSSSSNGKRSKGALKYCSTFNKNTNGTNSTEKILVLPSPSEIAHVDPIFPPRLRQIIHSKKQQQKQQQHQHQYEASPTRLVFGGCATLQRAVGQQPEVTRALLPLYRHRKHILIPDRIDTSMMHVVLHEDAQTEDAVLAALQAAAWQQWRCWRQQEHVLEDYEDKESIRNVAKECLECADELIKPVMMELKQSGWEIERVVVEARRRRAVW